MSDPRPEAIVQACYEVLQFANRSTSEATQPSSFAQAASLLAPAGSFSGQPGVQQAESQQDSDAPMVFRRPIVLASEPSPSFASVGIIDWLPAYFLHLNPDRCAPRGLLPAPPPPTVPRGISAPLSLVSISLSQARSRRASGLEDAPRAASRYLIPPVKNSPLVWLVPCTVAESQFPRLVRVPAHYRAFIMVKAASLLYTTEFSLDAIRDAMVSWFHNVYSIEQWHTGAQFTEPIAALQHYGAVCLLLMPGRNLEPIVSIMGTPVPPEVLQIINSSSAFGVPHCGFRRRIDATVTAGNQVVDTSYSHPFYASFARMLCLFMPSYVLVNRDADGVLRFYLRAMRLSSFSPAVGGEPAMDRYFETHCVWRSNGSFINIFDSFFEVAPNDYSRPRHTYQHYIRRVDDFTPDRSTLDALTKDETFQLRRYEITPDEGPQPGAGQS